MRTSKTKISDEELSILDFLFGENTTVGGLLNDICLSTQDGQETSIDSGKLVKLLNNLNEKGLVQLQLIALNKRILSTVGLTAKGGNIWENERKPLWESFVMDLILEHNDSFELNILSPSFEAANNFIQVSNKCGLYGSFVIDNLFFEEIIPDESFIPWKKFEKIYKVVINLEDYCSTSTISEDSIDWKYYNKNLNWWRTNSELQKLRRLD